MNILLTGWSGTIGYAIYRRLSVEHQVTRLGRSPESEIVGDFATLMEAEISTPVDAIVHCAGSTDEDFVPDPASGWKKSRNALRVLLEVAAEKKATHFVYFSTAHVYGPLERIIDENTATNPQTEYARCHLDAEEILRMRFKGALTLIRPNAVFGFPAFWDRFSRRGLIPFAFPLEAVERHCVTLKTSGTQKRNFCGAGDLAEIVENELSRSPMSGLKIINPVGKQTLSIASFAENCALEASRQTGQECKVIRNTEGEASSPFSYGSIWPQSPKEELGEFLSQMTSFAISKSQGSA